MLIQINTDNRLPGQETTLAAIEQKLKARLDRFAPKLSRIEAHLSDVNAERSGGDDILCALEARPNGRDPLAVTARAGTMEAAATGAADKMVASLERAFGRITTRKGH